MFHWIFDLWIFQWFGFGLIGAGLIGGTLFLTQRRQRASGGLGVGGDLPPGAGINISRVTLGADVAGLLVVIGVVLAFLPMLWGWFLAVAIGAVFVAVALFLWHRYPPW